MPEKTTNAKFMPDLCGTSGVARQLNVAQPTARAYAALLHSRGVKGILRADNGDYLATAAGIEAMARERDRRAERKPGG
ncbi:MAG: hypothetical protein JSS29_11080 [Proteobacteria bacterium]|nr:hypothetical protein [Pseudomonadota bacterium]